MAKYDVTNPTRANRVIVAEGKHVLISSGETKHDVEMSDEEAKRLQDIAKKVKPDAEVQLTLVKEVVVKDDGKSNGKNK